MVLLSGKIMKLKPENGYLFLFFVPLFLIFSCRPKNIDTYPHFSGFPDQNDSFSVGTTELWKNVHQKVTEGGQSAALILDHGEESLLLRVNLIRSARESISIQTFSWEFDEVGKFILWELIEANQNRGVKVNLLIDHMFNDHQLDIISYLSSMDSNFKIKYFNPSAKKLKPSFLDKISDLAIDFHDHNARLHNKLLVVDNKFAITGGRNINNHYFDEVIGLNYKDRDVLIIQNNPTKLENCINLYWDSEHSVLTDELKDVKSKSLLGYENNNYSRNSFIEYDVFQETNVRANSPAIIKELFVDKLLKVNSVEWVYDTPEKVKQAPMSNSSVTTKLSELIKSAKNEIYIQSPYVVISEQTQNIFRKLNEKPDKLKVVVSTNSLAATDNWVTYAANYKEKRIYIEELGFEMWEFKPVPGHISRMMNYEKLLIREPFSREIGMYGQKKFKINKNQLDALSINASTSLQNIHLQTRPYLSMHAKSFVFDNNISFVGSYNLDPRSEIYNTEMGVIIRDINFSQQLKESIKKDILPQNSYFVALKKNRPLLSVINILFYRLSEALPFGDIWPVKPHSCFELRQGEPQVNFGHPEFYNKWKNVGNFPGIPFLAKKQLSARIFKAAGIIFKPLL